MLGYRRARSARQACRDDSRHNPVRNIFEELRRNHGLSRLSEAGCPRALTELMFAASQRLREGRMDGSKLLGKGKLGEAAWPSSIITLGPGTEPRRCQQIFEPALSRAEAAREGAAAFRDACGNCRKFPEVEEMMLGKFNPSLFATPHAGVYRWPDDLWSPCMRPRYETMTRAFQVAVPRRD